MMWWWKCKKKKWSLLTYEIYGFLEPQWQLRGMAVVHRDVFVLQVGGEVVVTVGRDVENGGDAAMLDLLEAGGRVGVPYVQVG